MGKIKKYGFVKLRTQSGLKTIASAIAILIIGGFQPTVQAATLNEAARETLANNPIMLAAEAGKMRAEYAISAAKAGYLPTFNISGQAGYGNIENSTTRSRAELEGGTDDDRDNKPYGYNATIKQQIFSGFDTVYSVDSAELRGEAAHNDLIATREAMLLKTAEVYLTVIRAEHVYRLAEENVAEHEKIFNQVDELKNGGFGNLGDVNQAQSRLAQARERKVQLAGQLEDAKAKYFEIVGNSPGELIRPDLPEGLLPDSLDKALAAALASSPRMIASEKNNSAQRKDVKVEEASFYPSLELELSSQGDWDDNGYEEKTIDHRAMITVNFNLFNGGADEARRLQAIELANEATQKMHQVKREIEKTVSIDYQAFLTAKDSMDFLKDREYASLKALDEYHNQFKTGRRSLLDVLDVTNEMFQSKVSVLDGELALNFSKYKVLADMGQLAAALDVKDEM